MSGKRAQKSAEEARLNQRFRALENRLVGCKMVPSLNPTTFVERPWNSWTFESSKVTSAAFETVTTTVLDVLTQIATKNSLTAIEKCKIKVVNCKIWLTAKDLLFPDLECNFFEISGDLSAPQNPRSVQRDKGTLNMPAKCGYAYPIVDSKDIVSIDEGARKIASGLAVALNSEVTTRIRVLWQSS